MLKKMKKVSLSDESSNTLDKKIKKLKKYEALINENKPETSGGSQKKKHKKKRKSVSFNDETTVTYYPPDMDTSGESYRDENSNDPALVDPNSNTDEGIEQDIEDNNNRELDGGHRSFEEVQRNFNDMSKSERKKLKKKRRLEQKSNATNQFLEEVREDMAAFDENLKKRKLVQNDVVKKQKDVFKYSKKKKFIGGEKIEKQIIMNSIVESLDVCKISDAE